MSNVYSEVSQQKISDLRERCNGVKEKLEEEKDHSAFMEKLLDALYGKGWEKLTIADAKLHFQVICKHCGYPVGKWPDMVTRHCIHNL